MTKFSEKFTELRKAHGYTQAECASLLNVSRSSISLYESGKRMPDWDMMEKISAFFGVPITELRGSLTDLYPDIASQLVATSSSRLPSPDAWILDAYASAPERVRDIVKLTLEPYRQEAESSDLKKA